MEKETIDNSCEMEYSDEFEVFSNQNLCYTIKQDGKLKYLYIELESVIHERYIEYEYVLVDLTKPKKKTRLIRKNVLECPYWYCSKYDKDWMTVSEFVQDTISENCHHFVDMTNYDKYLYSEHYI